MNHRQHVQYNIIIETAAPYREPAATPDARARTLLLPARLSRILTLLHSARNIVLPFSTSKNTW